jgi:hypothetical protein
MRVILATFVVACVCGLCLSVSGCSGGRESLSDCEESETGYVLVLENSGLDCEHASIILGLIGSAEHGVQKIEDSEGGAWLCEGFPERSDAVKYKCRKGSRHFSVRTQDSR